MHYVKHFDILGIDTRQITCIELQGKPTTATEGAVGLFGMNMLSADHEVYVCIAVDGAIYTWIPLKGEGGITITEGKVNDVGELILTLSNGTTINAGVVTGKGCYVNGVPADLNFDSDPQTQIDERVKKAGDTISGILNVEGALTLPNSPDNPEKATVVDTYTSRKTANSDETGLTVVDGSTTTIEKIAGDTVKSANLIPFPYSYNSQTINGVTFTVNDDGTITVNGTATAETWFTLHLSGGTAGYTINAGTYTLSGNTISGLVMILNSNYNWRNRPVTFTFYAQKKLSLELKVEKGAVFENGIVYPMLNEGDTALPYVPYFSGLKHVNFSGIKSTGRNLIPTIPDRISNDNSKGQLESKNGVVTVGGVINTSSLQATYDMLSAKTWISTYPNYYKLAEDDLNIFPGTYTISIKATAGVNCRIGILFGKVGSQKSDNTATLIYLKDRNVTTQGKIISTTFTVSEPMKFVLFANLVVDTIGEDVGYSKISDIMLNVGETALPYEPYIEKTYQLPKTIELGKYDTFNPKTGELTRGSKTIVFDGSENWELKNTYVSSGLAMFYLPLTEKAVDYTGTIICPDYPTYIRNSNGPFGFGLDEELIYTLDGKIYINTPLYLTLGDWKAYLQTRYANGNPVTAMYQKETPTVETLLNVPISYTVFDGGTETIVQGEVDNSQWGAIPKITQTYNIHENPKEAANKAYVRNGLAKKLDKTGGKITGTLIVEGGTDTALSALVVKNNDATYGLAYEGDAYKLGQGTVDEKGNFAFNAGEGLPVALRDDSETFTDGHLVVWSAEGNKFVDGGDAVVDKAKSISATAWTYEIVGGKITNFNLGVNKIERGNIYAVSIQRSGTSQSQGAYNSGIFWARGSADNGTEPCDYFVVNNITVKVRYDTQTISFSSNGSYWGDGDGGTMKICKIGSAIDINGNY